MKKILKILGVAAALFVVALVAAFFVIKSQFPPEKIKAIVEKEATDALKREVSVGSAGIKLWPLGIKLEGLKIANNPGGGFSKDPFLEVPLAVVKIDLAKLLILQVAIDKISFENMSLLYEVMPDGRTSIDGLGGEPDTTKKEVVKDTSKLDLSKIELPGSLSLNSFEIKNAKVIYNDRAQKSKMILGNINLRTSLSLDKTLENVKASLALTLKDISIDDAGAGIRKGDISVFLKTDLAGNLRLQYLNIQNFSVGLQSVTISASGTLNKFLEEVMVADLKIESNQINLAQLIKEIPTGINPEIPKISAGGTLAFNAAVKGAITKDNFPASGNLIFDNISISHSDLPAGLSALTGNIAFTENTVNVKPFTFALAGQQNSILLDVSDLMSKQPKLNDFVFDTKLDLGTLFALANKLVTIKDLTSLTGRIEANLSARGILDPTRPENLAVNGGINLINVVANTPMIPDAVSLNGAVRVSNTEISMDPAVRIGNSDVRVKLLVRDYLAMVMPKLAAGKKTNINLDVASSNLLLDRLLPPGDPNKPEEESIPMEIYPELPDLVANVNINLANTVFRHLTLSDFNMGINYASSRVNIAGRGRLYTGTFNTNVAVDLSNRKSADVKFGLNVDKVEANDFISNGVKNVSGESAMAKQLRDLNNTVFGKITMKMDVSTKGLPQNFVDNLNGPISLQITNGSLKGSKILGSVGEGISNFEIAGRKVLSGVVPVSSRGDMNFDNLSASLEAKNGQLLVSNFDMNARTLGSLAFSGGIGFGGDLNLKLQNTLTSSASSNLNNLTRASPVSLYPSDASGNALLFFNIGGTFTDPKVTLDAQKMSSSASDLRGMAAAKLDDAKARLNEEKARLEARAKAEADRIKAEADAKKREAEAKARAQADAQKQKATSAAKSKATDALKGIRR
ncbi:MAG: hypothetical protein LBU89_01610 [Fibromonadaceae bacterium]|jgi:hypothetical protein|nr:hypothetical protein [Fibromonadaceae bacterium]